jgi:hypothetical protein
MLARWRPAGCGWNPSRATVIFVSLRGCLLGTSRCFCVGYAAPSCVMPPRCAGSTASLTFLVHLAAPRRSTGLPRRHPLRPSGGEPSSGVSARAPSPGRRDGGSGSASPRSGTPGSTGSQRPGSSRGCAGPDASGRSAAGCTRRLVRSRGPAGTSPRPAVRDPRAPRWEVPGPRVAVSRAQPPGKPPGGSAPGPSGAPRERAARRRTAPRPPRPWSSIATPCPSS